MRGSTTALLIGRLGDFLIATPFLRALRRSSPRLRLIVSAACAEAARRVGADEVFEFHKLRAFPRNLGLATALARRTELLVDLNPSFSRTAAALIALARARRKAGFRKGRLDGVYTEQAAAPAVEEHMLDRYRRLAALLGLAYDEDDWEFRVGERDEDEAGDLLDKIADKRIVWRILLHAGNFKKFDNRWPEEKFVALADRLARLSGTELFFLAGPGERGPVEGIASRLEKPAPVLSGLSLGATAALLRRMDLCVLNITGTTHLARAVGAPTFGLYSGYTNAVWRPRGAIHSGAVSPSWKSCREISVDEAYRGVVAQLNRLAAPQK